MKHPRFGDVRCVRSLRIIEKGEEIYEDYGYAVNGVTNEDVPKWYLEKLDQIQNSALISEMTIEEIIDIL